MCEPSSHALRDWTTQPLLAAILLATGLTKLSQPRAQLAAGPTVHMGEPDRLAVPLVILVLTLFVAVERFGPL